MVVLKYLCKGKSDEALKFNVGENPTPILIQKTLRLLWFRIWLG